MDSFANNRKFGFTLAEVLITLGIIGVVAAITLPTLIQNYKRHVVANKLKTDVSILQQALQRSIADNGTPDTWNVEPLQTDVFDVYFKPYLKVLYAGNSRFIIRNTTEPETGNGYLRRVYKLSNGTIITYQHAGVSAKGNRRGRFYILMKNNKKDRQVYTVGKDAFPFNFIINEDDGKYYITSAAEYRPDYWFICKQPHEYLKEICVNGSGGRGYTSGIGCSALIECNSWEFPKDYPIKL